MMESSSRCLKRNTKLRLFESAVLACCSIAPGPSTALRDRSHARTPLFGEPNNGVKVILEPTSAHIGFERPISDSIEAMETRRARPNLTDSSSPDRINW